jgi:hypothetical protein
MSVYFRMIRFSQGKAKWREITLPVNPEEITFKAKGRNQGSEIVGLGEINRLRKPGLVSFSINGILPAYVGFHYVEDPSHWHHPREIVEWIDLLRADRTSFLFTLYEDMDWTLISSESSVKNFYGSMTGGLASVTSLIGDVMRNEPRQPMAFSRRMSVDDFDWGYRAQDEDVHYTLECREYRDYSAQKVTKKSTDDGTVVKTDKKTRVSSELYEGALVTVNGPLYLTSYGEKPGKTLTGYDGYLARMLPDKTRKSGYLVSDADGVYLGWVAKSQLTLTETS